jgi:hypothetical protein
MKISTNKNNELLQPSFVLLCCALCALKEHFEATKATKNGGCMEPLIYY